MSDRPESRMGWVVLVVEDDLIVRIIAVEALQDAGFVVVEAEHAADALSILHSSDVIVDALFTDVHMPGDKNGVDLAHETRRHWPWVRLLVASGKLMPAQSELPDGCGFLPKPYELQQLINHLRDMAAT